MKVHFNLDNFDNKVFPTQEEIDSIASFNTLIPIGKSGIHIKKKNRGLFTKYCGGNVTDACIQRGKNSSDPAVRKRATFAESARKWKHQSEGTLTPSFSDLFIDSGIPFYYKPKLTNIKEPKLPDYLTTTSKNEVSTTLEPATVKPPSWYNTAYESPSAEEPNWDWDAVNFNDAKMSDNLRAALTPHMGITGKWGNYDCSNFATRVLHDMGHKNVGGNSRKLYELTDRINMSDLKEGDLIFLQGTQGNKIPAGLASHVAIVTDASELGNGYVYVANGSPEQKTQIKKLNLNKGYYKDHYLGAGRIRQGKLGMKAPFKELQSIPAFVLKQKEESVKKPSWYNTVYSPDLTSAKKLDSYSNKKLDSYSERGYNLFKLELNNYFSVNPFAKKYEKVLTDIAKHESNFNPSILNTAGAPAYGYFQFWQDGNINNVTKFSGLNINDFLHNPQAQIDAAVKMIQSIEKSFNTEDLRIASAKGYNMNQLIRGAWLGGVGGVRKVLRGLGNPSDGKWYKNGKGRTVKQAMDEQT